MSCHPETDTRFLTRPRPPSISDVKLTLWAVGALVLLSFAIDTVRLILQH
jgi:hypothetical protein